MQLSLSYAVKWLKNHLLSRWQMPLAIATLASGTIVAGGLALDQHRIADYRATVRGEAEHALADTSQQIRNQLRRDLMLTNNLINLLTYKVDFDGAKLADESVKALEGTRHPKSIMIAPDNRLSHIVTHEGIVRVNPHLHADRQPPQIRQVSALLSFPPDMRKSFLAVDNMFDQFYLINPVYREDGTFWGSLALSVDRDGFLDESGIREVAPGNATLQLSGADSFDVVLVGQQADAPQILIGDPAIVEKMPLKEEVDLLQQVKWQVMVAPSRGWDALPADQTRFRFFLISISLFAIVPIFTAAFLVGERNRNIETLKAREANLLELSQRFNLAMETSNIGIWEVKADNNLIWDDRAALLHGREPDPTANRLEEWLGTIYPEDLAAAEAHFFTSICSTSPCTNIYRIILPTGDVRYLRSAGASYRNSDLTTHTTGIVWDVTSDMMVNKTLRDAKADSDIKNAELELALEELSNREQELEETSSRLNLALASYNCGIWESSPHQHLEIWDERMCQLYGIPYSDGLMTHERWLELIHPEDRFMAKRLTTAFPTSVSGEPLTVRVPQPDGSIRYVRSIGKKHIMRDRSIKLVGIAFDVTADMRLTQQLQAAKQEAEAKNVELELAKHRIEHNALHDPLTGLANRRKLDLELDALSQESRNRRMQVSILHLDLDRFKQINDTLGHAAGDSMLVYAAKILERNVRPNDLVARIGGDEFVIVARDTADADAMAELSARIINEIRQPLDFEGFSCRCGVSIGIAQAGGTRIDGRRMLVDADIALYRAKNLGRNRFEFFTQNLQAEIITHKRTADELLTAFEEQQFVTWYQPQFCARNMQLTGVEALVRWRHPHRGILSPDAFLKIAEDLNVTANLDQIVLETVLKDQMRWAAMGVDIPKVSVNVSSKRLKDESLIETLQTLPITPGRLSFELVESIFLDEQEDCVTRNLERIKALGIDIEIDDFGTGHTSIVSLLKLRPKRLKIDRQLVMPILTSPQERALVRAIIEIARSLGVETVAEGVETMQHGEILREMGCDLLQGYAFARPLPFDRFTEIAMREFLRAS